MEELVAEPLVMHTPEHGTRRLFDQAVNEASLKYRMVVEASVSEVAQSLAVGSLGVAVVSDDARYGLRALAIETGGRDLCFELFAAWDPTHFAAATIEAWAQQLAGSTARTGGRPAQVRKRPRRPPGPRGQHRAVQPGMAPTGPAGEGGPDATR